MSVASASAARAAGVSHSAPPAEAEHRQPAACMAERGGIDRMRRDRACDAVRRGAQRVRDAQRTAEQGGRIICRVSVSVGIYEAQRHVERLRRFFQYAITDCRCGRNDGRERQPRETLRIECCINACGKRFIRVDSPRIDADHDAARMNHEFARTAPCVGGHADRMRGGFVARQRNIVEPRRRAVDARRRAREQIGHEALAPARSASA